MGRREGWRNSDCRMDGMVGCSGLRGTGELSTIEFGGGGTS